MAKMFITGIFESAKYTSTSVIVIVSERRRGYKRKDGTVVDDELFMWKVLFPPIQRKYIAEHFGNGMLVDIYAIALPYGKDHDGNSCEGYSLLGKNIDMATWQKTFARQEKKMVKDGEMTMEKPKLEEYLDDDF